MRIVIFTGTALLLCAPARGDDVVETAPVVVEDTRLGADDPGPAGPAAAAPGSRRALEEPAFVTVVPLDGRNGEQAPLAEVLAESVGVTVRSFGGLGAFASLSMRGSPSAQTEILVDGVPLSRVAFSSLDVGALDLGTFERVEIYRGGVPVELGGAVLGGAVNFVTAVGPGPDGKRTLASAGGGSFGMRQARLSEMFRHTTGRPLRAEIEEARVNAACRQLVETHQPLKMLAHHLAFTHTSAFCYWFKQSTGLTPTEYRIRRAVTCAGDC